MIKVFSFSLSPPGGIFCGRCANQKKKKREQKKGEKGQGSETEGEGVTRERQKKPGKGEYPKCSQVFFSRLEERR
jgi:hypothetical protein